MLKTLPAQEKKAGSLTAWVNILFVKMALLVSQRKNVVSVRQVMTQKNNILITLFCLIISPISYGNEISGLVIKIIDGDTLTILTNNNDQIKIRLTEIDAPEKKQAFGNKSKISLSKICFNKVATVNSIKIDKYGRTLGRVTCNYIDANSKQIEQGMAWVYDKYVTDLNLYTLQENAKIKKLGLWSDPYPIQPWAFRHKK